MKWWCVNLQPLRAGGYGDLYVGLRSDTGERVVVKFLRDKHLAHAKKAFAREVRILAQRLRGLVPLLSADTDGERPYYIMPFVEGGALSRYAGRFSEVRLHNVAKELATTLANLHGASIAHGDFKPDNVLVSKEGRLQVADPLGNGIGCTVLFSQNHGGTPGYWAPEVARGGSISMAGDVYSYGATLYELRTGRKPRDGQSFALSKRDSLQAHKISEIIGACCQSSPDARPNMKEVLRMLDGETWTAIEAERKQRQQLLAGVGIVGGFLLLVRFLKG